MTSPDLATLVTAFFVRHLAAERNVSRHTTTAYRDALSCCSGLPGMSAHRPVVALRFEDLTPSWSFSFSRTWKRSATIPCARAMPAWPRFTASSATSSNVTRPRHPVSAGARDSPQGRPRARCSGTSPEAELAHLLAQVERETP